MQAHRGCEWRYFGLTNQEKCELTGQVIDDCPAGGPTAKGFYGQPVSLLTLTGEGESEDFILVDSSHWEYHGFSIGRIVGLGISNVQDVFADTCSGT